MSKSLGNAICFNDLPADMYGRMLSIPDTLITNYCSLLLPPGTADSHQITEESVTDPRTAKRMLARNIVALYYSSEAAEEAESHFDRVFVQKKAPDNIELVKLPHSEITVVDLLVELGAASSKTDARRMIQQKSVLLDEERIEEITASITLSMEPKTLRAGKRKFFRIATEKKG